jgi:hypothetical protein
MRGYWTAHTADKAQPKHLLECPVAPQNADFFAATFINQFDIAKIELSIEYVHGGVLYRKTAIRTWREKEKG